MNTQQYSHQMTEQDHLAAALGGELPGLEEIAEYPDRRLDEMRPEELIRIVRSAQRLLPACDCGPHRLTLMDRETLMRLGLPGSAGLSQFTESSMHGILIPARKMQ